jgi:L-ribulose-5-phosphate 4-epimerase
MTADEIKADYEANTGQVIVERFEGVDPGSFPGVLVASHGPFAWDKTVAGAVNHAEVIEFLARLASETLRIRPDVAPMQTALHEKHFFRKHGSGAYYGQKRSI